MLFYLRRGPSNFVTSSNEAYNVAKRANETTEAVYESIEDSAIRRYSQPPNGDTVQPTGETVTTVWL